MYGKTMFNLRFLFSNHPRQHYSRIVSAQFCKSNEWIELSKNDCRKAKSVRRSPCLAALCADVHIEGSNLPGQMKECCLLTDHVL